MLAYGNVLAFLFLKNHFNYDVFLYTDVILKVNNK